MSTRRKSTDITKLLEQQVILRQTIPEVRPKKSVVRPVIQPIVRSLYPIKEISNNGNGKHRALKAIKKGKYFTATAKENRQKGSQWNFWNIKPSISMSSPIMMTRRSRTLDIHSLSKTNFDRLHPLPEKAEEPLSAERAKEFCEPLLLEDDGEDALSLSTSSITTDGSTSTFCCDSLSSVRTLGNTSTGRSSVYSWGNEDEFDRKAASEVRCLFDEVDTCLFETNTNLGNDLQDECENWKSTFPYLRLLGTQLLDEKDGGTQLIASESDRLDNLSLFDHHTMLRNVEGDSGNQVLAVNGAKMEVTNQMETNSDGGFLEEEIFAIDGDMEEFIAYDCGSEIREENNHNKRPAMPPITPHNFAHNSALNECFDRVWSQIVKTLTGLLKLYIQVRAKKELANQQQNSIYDVSGDRFLESSLELPSTSDTYGSRLNSQMKSKSSSGLFSSDLDGLKDLMTIRSVSLNQRAPSVNVNIIREDEIHNGQNRPESSMTVVGHRQVAKFRTTDQQFQDRMISSKGQKRAIRLQPIQTPKTTNQAEPNVGGVRGTRMSMTGERSLSPPHVLSNQQTWGHRNGTLPPLDRMATADLAASYKENRAKSAKKNTRASSAVINQSKHSSQRDRINQNTIQVDSRPNTLQTIRTEIYPSKGVSSNHQSKVRDSSFPAKTGFHSHSQSMNDGNFQHNSSQGIKTDDLQHEFDDFVLWGHGPPLISQQQRRGKTVNSSNLR